MAKNNNKKIKENEETEVTQVTETTEVNEVNDVVEEIVTEATKVKTNTEGTEVVEETPEIKEETPEEVKTETEVNEVKTEVKDCSFILKLLSEANWYSQYVFGSHLKNKFESTVEDVKKFYDEFKNGNYLASELDYRIFRELTNYFQTTKSSI